MRIGVFHNKPYYLRYYETALRELLARGHQLVLARPDRFEGVKPPRSMREHENVSTTLYPWRRGDGLDDAVDVIRLAREAARYLSPELREARASRELAFRRLAARVSANSEAGRDLDWLDRLDSTPGQKAVDRIFEELERLVPPDERILDFVRSQELEVLVSISRINVGGRQSDVVKCALALDIPVGVIVYSWDNLTAMGALHVAPDRLFVWNETQVREAGELHGLDPERVVVTGAPRFDPVFEQAPSGPREELLRNLGLDPARATILYLGSSTVVALNEPELVTSWTYAVRSSDNARVRDANILVRPHPQTAVKTQWSEWTPPEGIVVAPRVVRNRAQDLVDQLSASDVVVALNTSAEIEAAILDKPVLTIKVGEQAPGQEGQWNFGYLLEEDGGFVQTASRLDEHVTQLVEALERDPLAKQRRAFLRSFVRPRGLDVPAGRVLADEIERLAAERNSSGAAGSVSPELADLPSRAAPASTR